MPKNDETIGIEKWNLDVDLRHNRDKGINKCEDEDNTSVC